MQKLTWEHTNLGLHSIHRGPAGSRAGDLSSPPCHLPAPPPAVSAAAWQSLTARPRCNTQSCIKYDQNNKCCRTTVRGLRTFKLCLPPVHKESAVRQPAGAHLRASPCKRSVEQKLHECRHVLQATRADGARHSSCSWVTSPSRLLPPAPVPLQTKPTPPNHTKRAKQATFKLLFSLPETAK